MEIGSYSVVSKDIPRVYEMWSDVFVFQKKYYNAPHLNSDRSNEEEVSLFWEMCIKEADELSDKYKDMKLCSRVIVSVMQDISERGSIKNGKE